MAMESHTCQKGGGSVEVSLRSMTKVLMGGMKLETVENRELGSRLMGINPVRQGMPWWKYLANRFLTKLENWVFGLNLSEYHTGYRAYSREALQRVNFEMNSDRFIFDQEIVAQLVELKVRFVEVPVPTRYFAEASSATFWQSCRYGLSILWLLLRYVLHRTRLYRQRRFDSLTMRYRVEPPPEQPSPAKSPGAIDR